MRNNKKTAITSGNIPEDIKKHRPVSALQPDGKLRYWAERSVREHETRKALRQIIARKKAEASDAEFNLTLDRGQGGGSSPSVTAQDREPDWISLTIENSRKRIMAECTKEEQRRVAEDILRNMERQMRERARSSRGRDFGR